MKQADFLRIMRVLALRVGCKKNGTRCSLCGDWSDCPVWSVRLRNGMTITGRWICDDRTSPGFVCFTTEKL
jgi:hypothetical protein